MIRQAEEMQRLVSDPGVPDEILHHFMIQASQELARRKGFRPPEGIPCPIEISNIDGTDGVCFSSERGLGVFSADVVKWLCLNADASGYYEGGETT